MLPLDSRKQLTDEIDSDLQKLQSYVNESSYFLASYEIRKAQDAIQEALKQFSSIKSALNPQGKFSFKGKKKEHSAGSSSAIKDNLVVNKTPDAVESKRFATEETLTTLGSGVVVIDQKDALLDLDSGKVSGKDVLLMNLMDSKVLIHSVPNTLRLQNLKGCNILAMPVSTSVFVEYCENCTFAVACQQLRVHNTKNCIFYLHVTSRGIIEDCSDIKVAPYCLNENEEALSGAFELAKLNRGKNNWDSLDDFNWLSPSAPSPNWSVLPVESRRKFSFSDFKK